MVQIHDDKPRIGWKTTVVEELVKGNDGLVRSAVVRTKTGRTSRPIVKLYPLEIHHADVDTATEEPEDKATTDDIPGRTLPNRQAAQRAVENIKVWTKSK